MKTGAKTYVIFYSYFHIRFPIPCTIAPFPFLSFVCVLVVNSPSVYEVYIDYGVSTSNYT